MPPKSRSAALVAVVFHPSRTFANLARLEVGFGPLLLCLFIELCFVYPEILIGHLMRAVHNPVAGITAAWMLYLNYAIGPLFACLVLGVVAHYGMRRLGVGVDILQSAALFGFAIAPHTLLVAASAAAGALGFDHPVLPHHRVAAVSLSSAALFLKVALAYGFSVALVIIAFVQLRHTASAPAAPDFGVEVPKRVVVALVAFFVAAALPVGLEVAMDWERVRPAVPGDPLPEFELPALDGGASMTRAGLEGKVVLVDFWATWCPPCVASMPELEALHREFSGTDFRLVSVNVETSQKDAVAAFVQEHGLSFSVYLDDGEFQRRLQVQSYPTSYLVGRDGRISRIDMGMVPRDIMQKRIRELLERGPENL